MHIRDTSELYPTVTTVSIAGRSWVVENNLVFIKYCNFTIITQLFNCIFLSSKLILLTSKSCSHAWKPSADNMPVFMLEKLFSNPSWNMISSEPTVLGILKIFFLSFQFCLIGRYFALKMTQAGQIYNQHQVLNVESGGFNWKRACTKHQNS